MTVPLNRGEVASYYAARVPKVRQTKGREWRGPCPVHNGKRDSFAVDAETGRACCHSECGRGWDPFSLEMELSGTDFKTAKAQVFRLVGRTVTTAPSAARGQVGNQRKIVAEYSYCDAAGRCGTGRRRRRRPPGAGREV